MRFVLSAAAAFCGVVLILSSCRDHTTGDQASLTGPAPMEFTEPVILSEEFPQQPGGAFPGDAAGKGRILRLNKTAQSARDGRLIAVYADAATTGEVWHPRLGTHRALDIFVRFSDDEGATWTNPVNLSNTARCSSALTDWNGDGVAEVYWGDSGKPNVYSHGDGVVVSWTDKYCPEESWVWGESGESTVQGRASYPDIEVVPEMREIPYSGVYVAISVDGGESWIRGGSSPPLQLTHGRRDAIQEVHRGSGKKWVMTWQEDPEGLQQGEGDGPGPGASGAKTTKGTDIWYTFTPDIAAAPDALRSNRTPLSNNSEYDTTSANGFALAGSPGSIENHGSSRANPFLVKQQDTFRALVVYEESKGLPDIAEGKTVQYHSFPFSQPVQIGPPEARCGDAGRLLSDELQNARRARIVAQPPDGSSPAVVLLWRQSYETEGGPADILVKVCVSLDPEAVAAAKTLNMSASTLDPEADHLEDPTDANSIEDARAHRAILRGKFVAVAYVYTPNGPLARFTDQENYDLYLRRSFDGGLTWTEARDVSRLEDSTLNVKEPRMVPAPKTGVHDENVLVVAWGTESNVYEGVEEPIDLDIEITRTFDQGESYEPVSLLPGLGGALDHESFESQIRIDDTGRSVYAVWMDADPTGIVNVLFARHEKP